MTRSGISAIFTVFFIILMVFVARIAVAETQTIEHPITGEAIELRVPEDASDLRSAYIEMAKLYLGSSHDLEEALELIEDQEETIADLKGRLEESERLNKELAESGEEIAASGTVNFLNVVTANANAEVLSGDFGGALAYGVVIRERLIGQVQIGVPLQVGLQFGWMW